MLRYRERRLRALLAVVYRRSRFYRDLYDRAGIDVATARPEDLPPVTKEMLMADFDRVVTVPDITRQDLDRYCERYARGPGLPPRYKGRYIVTRSSGSGGLKGTFVYDTRGFRAMLESTLAYCPRDLVSPAQMPVRIAGLFSADSFHLGYMLFLRMKLPGVRAVAIPAASPMAAILDALGREQPTILAGYPSILGLLSDEVVAGRLLLSPLSIFSGGERLTRNLRAKIQNAFGCPVYDYYGCAEANPIAMECDEHRLHLIEDSVVLEPVDARLRPVRPGQASAACLLTNLNNPILPILRYQLSDQVVVSDKPCPCGCPFVCLETIEGRWAELLYMMGRDGRDVTIHPTAIFDIVERDLEVSAVQMLQDRRNRIQLKVVPVRDAQAGAVRSRVTEGIHQYLTAEGIAVDEHTLSLDFVDHLQPGPVSGKVLDFQGIRGP